MAADLVYTWVNSGDAEWKKKRQAKLVEVGARYSAHGTGDFRHFDHQELRYSLRSAEKNLPFLNRVFIVIDGSAPAWLRTSKDLVIVRSEELIQRKDLLPTYNSDTIEAFLHKIDGLGEKYLYSNDDYFVRAPLRESDFFTADGKAIVRMRRGLLTIDLGEDDPTFSHMARNTVRALAKLGRFYRPHLPSRKPIPLWIRRWLRSQYPFNLPEHIVQPFRKSIWSEVETLFHEELERHFRHPFRSVEGVCVNTLAHYLSYARKLSEFSFKDEEIVLYREASASQIEEVVSALKRASPSEKPFLCLNDGEDINGLDWPKLVSELLASEFPQASRWEYSRSGAEKEERGAPGYSGRSDRPLSAETM